MFIFFKDDQERNLSQTLQMDLERNRTQTLQMILYTYIAYLSLRTFDVDQIVMMTLVKKMVYKEAIHSSENWHSPNMAQWLISPTLL